MSMSLLLGLLGVPHLLILMGGIGLAVARWTQHPTVSMMVVLSCGLDLMVRAAYFVVPLIAARVDAANDTHSIFTILSTVSSALGAISQVLILIAVFSERKTGTEAPVQRW